MPAPAPAPAYQPSYQASFNLKNNFFNNNYVIYLFCLFSQCQLRLQHQLTNHINQNHSKSLSRPDHL